MTTLVAGSYERFLFAYSIKKAEEDKDQVYTLPRAFSFPAHKGPVKCVAAAAPFVASGGADDTVHIYNAQTSADLGFLMNPGEGAITALAFFTPGGGGVPSHLLSGAADGSIAVWAAGGGWDCMKLLKGHKKEVTGLAVHPSGLLALSTAQDDMLRMWNMTKGRSQYKTKVTPGTAAVGFSPSGGTYALLSSAQVTVHGMEEEGGVSASFDLDRRGICMAHLSEQVLLVGCEDGSLRVLDARSSTPAQTVHRAHGSRIRGVACVPSSSSGEGSAAAWQAGSASSDGTVRLWDLRNSGGAMSSSRAQPLCEASTSARLTCLCAMSPPNSRSSKANGALRKPARQQAHSVSTDEAAQRRAASAADSKKREESAAVEAAKRAAQLAEKREQEREKRERKRAAAAAQHQGEEEARKGVLVKRKAETVVEFPDEPQRPKKATVQKKKKKKGLKTNMQRTPFDI